MSNDDLIELAKGLLPCPLCGGDKGYSLSEGSTYRWWDLNCKSCGENIGECASDRRMKIGEPLPKRWSDADCCWNLSAKYCNKLRLELAKQSARIAELEAQLARYEAVAYINRNETGQISIKDINDNAFDISKRVGTKLFALKDEK